VFFEQHQEIRTAIQREKNMKHWPRAWKIALIVAQNPDWDDLYPRIL
jgi:putative endonuclease